jgi:hypothetical protein
LDETDSVDSGRKMLNVGKQMASLQLNNNNNDNNTSNNNNNNTVKLKPVVTKKTAGNHVNSALRTLNNHKFVLPPAKPHAFLSERLSSPPAASAKKVCLGHKIDLYYEYEMCV